MDVCARCEGNRIGRTFAPSIKLTKRMYETDYDVVVNEKCLR